MHLLPQKSLQLEFYSHQVLTQVKLCKTETYGGCHPFHLIHMANFEVGLVILNVTAFINTTETDMYLKVKKGKHKNEYNVSQFHAQTFSIV